MIGTWLVARSSRQIGEAVLAGHHHVEHDQVDRGVVERPAHFAGVSGDADAAAVGRQETRQEIADFAVVVDDEARGDWLPWPVALG